MPNTFDLSIFPDGLRETVAAHQAFFRGARMEVEQSTEGEQGNQGEQVNQGDGSTEQDEQLGDAGKKALTAERARVKEAERLNKELTDKVSGMETTFSALIEALTGKAPEAEVTADDAVNQLTELKNQLEQRDKAAADKTRRAEIKAAATAAGFSDPSDALAYIDLSKVDINDDGDVDSAAVASLVDELAKKKPYLVKNQTPGAGQIGVGKQGSSDSTLSGIGRVASALKSKTK